MDNSRPGAGSLVKITVAIILQVCTDNRFNICIDQAHMVR